MSANTESNFKIGDILIWNTGYSMILPHFGKVVGFTPSGKSVRVVELGSTLINDDGYGQQGHKIPTNNIVSGAKAYRLKKYMDREYAMIDKHIASKWDGKPAWYDMLD